MSTPSHTRYSVAEVAAKLNVDMTAALGLIRFLSDRDVALDKAHGSRHFEGKRGRGPSVYSFVEGFEEKMAAWLKGKL